MSAEPYPHSYDKVLVAFSGGKDSLAMLLDLLDRGVPREKIELHHHDVDGGVHWMDWPCTKAYTAAVAKAFGIPIVFSWREGGFYREMRRKDQPTGAVHWRQPWLPEGHSQVAGGRGPPGTRGRFPQVSADLSVRWCSSYLKIDVMSSVIRNDTIYNVRDRLLVVTGERAQESKARSRYKVFEPHRSHCKSRHVDHWRPVLSWSEELVWDAIQHHRVNPHPAYRLGWGRVSCALCIFGSPRQWASARVALPEMFQKIAEAEKASGLTIQRGKSVVELADSGEPYPMDPAVIAEANNRGWNEPVFLPEGQWRLPRGAFGDSAGPT